MNEYKVRALGVVSTVQAASTRVAVNRGLDAISRHRTRSGMRSVDSVAKDDGEVSISVELVRENIPKRT